MDLCSLSKLLEDLKTTEAYLKDCSGLTFKEAAMLCSIGSGKKEPAKLAKDMNLSPSRASRLISALESKGLTVRRTSEIDKRIVVLNLSKAGSKLLDNLHQTDLPFPDYLQRALDEITESREE
jgi:DNA-binding MarR family transcriptional regulator